MNVWRKSWKRQSAGWWWIQINGRKTVSILQKQQYDQPLTDFQHVSSLTEKLNHLLRYFAELSPKILYDSICVCVICYLNKKKHPNQPEENIKMAPLIWNVMFFNIKYIVFYYSSFQRRKKLFPYPCYSWEIEAWDLFPDWVLCITEASR